MDFQSRIRKSYSLLFPTGRAWQYVRGSEDREAITENYTDGVDDVFTDGVGQPFYYGEPKFNASDGKAFADTKLKIYDQAYEDAISVQYSILPDNDKFDETDASRWESVLGIPNTGQDLESRKQRISRQLNYPNGIVERSHYKFIEDQLRAAGFDVYIVENRFWNGSEFEVIDPVGVGTEDLQYGVGEYGESEYGGEIAGVDYTSIIANFIDENLDNVFFDAAITDLVQYGEEQYGEFQYGAGAESLSRDKQLQATFFLGGSSFPSIVTVDAARKDELRQLVLKLKPTHTLCFEYINYI